MLFNIVFRAGLLILYFQSVVVLAIAEHLFGVAFVIAYLDVGYLAFVVGDGFVYWVYETFIRGYVEFRIAFFHLFV